MLTTTVFRLGLRSGSTVAILAAFLLLITVFSGNASTRMATPTPSPTSTASGWIITGPRSIVLGHGASGALDSVAVFKPCMVRAVDGSYLLYYTGYDGFQDHVMEATSPDGANWTRVGEAVSLNNGNAAPFVMIAGATYHMWFESIIWGIGPLGYLDQIYHTTSSDGLAWSTPALALGVGNPGDWDGGSLVDPRVARDASGLYRMYYTMAAVNHSSAIGVATSSDLVSWAKWPRNPVLLPGAVGTWDEDSVAAPSVVAGSSWTLFFEGRRPTTGYRIGVATSADGYDWTPSPQPFLSNETAGSWDSYEVSSPTLFGGSSTPELIFDGDTGPYSNTIGRIPLEYVVAGAPGASSWTVTGNGFQDGGLDRLSLSPNGSVALGSGTAPSNRRMVIDVGPPGSADSLYARVPFVLKDTDGTYKMWYSGQDGFRNRLLYAISPDGIHWAKQGVVIDVLTPPYYFDSVGGQAVIKNGSTYVMWFQGGFWSGGAFGYWSQIYRATSTNGANWTITGVVLPPNQAWDRGMTNAPWVVQDPHGLYWMFFMGWDGTTDRIGVATSKNGTWFIPYAGNPIINLGSAGSWDSVQLNAPSASLNGSTWTLWYEGYDGHMGRIGTAVSTNGYNWTKTATNPILGAESSPSWDDAGVGTPGYFLDPTGPRLYFAGSDGHYLRIGMTTFGPPPAANLSGAYQSAVFDSGTNGTRWQNLSWTGAAPADTSLSIKVRVGNSSIPDAGWTPWVNLGAPGASEPPATSALHLPRARFVQFGIAMRSVNWTQVPWVQSVSVAYGPDRPPETTLLAPAANAWTNAPQPTLQWNAVDPENDSVITSEVQVSATSDFATTAASSGDLPAGASSWQVPSALSEGSWYWRVRTEDAYGLWSPWVSSSFKLDSTPPLLLVASPLPGTILRSHSLDVLWLAQDNGSGLGSVQVSVDSGAPLVVGPGNLSAHLTSIPDGEHTITVRAFDVAGNVRSAAVTVIVDTTSPSVAITSPATGALFHSGSFQVTWTATDAGSGLDRVLVSVDGGTPVPLSAGTTSWNLTGLADGVHTITVTAYDRAGNVQSATTSVTVDTNLLSLNGPAGPWVDVALILVIVGAAAAAAYLLLRARKKGQPPAP